MARRAARMNARAAKADRPRRRRLALAAALALALATGIAAGEALGWPFLALPLQQAMSDALGRRVLISVDPGRDGSAQQPFRARFVGGLRLSAPGLEVGAPAWSSAPHLLVARDVTLELRYADLWRAHRGEPLRIDRLRAAALDAWIERRGDGRVSWQFGPPATPSGDAQWAFPIPAFGSLQVASGELHLRDELLALDLEARLSLADGVAEPSTSEATGSRLRVDARGHYAKWPMTLELASQDVLPRPADGAAVLTVPLTLKATVGRASLVFEGSAADALHLDGLAGHFTLKGPSLAAVGDPLGVTLPTTSAFHTEGSLVRQGDIWYVLIADTTVGASHLNGAFTYDGGRHIPLLSGRLGGARLMMADLGPVVGLPPKGVDAPAASARASAPASTPGAAKSRGKVLPDRHFDLAALRAMDANVLIDIRDVDLNSSYLQPLRPLRGHLQLAGGILTLSRLDARTAEGQAGGELRLDGRGAEALWNSDLRWDGVRLEHWIRQPREDAAPPFISGRLSGRASLTGAGRSTAEILASLKGQVRMQVHGGSVSHLAIEAAGLDLAQGLGLLLVGDDALPVQCAVADLVAEAGVLHPRVLVLDTTDSVIWIDGSLSLASETIDLRAVVTPKDFSPLTLRTPLRVRGSFARPDVSLEKGPLGLKVAASIALAFVNPLAALIPWIDPGNTGVAGPAVAGCPGLLRKSVARVSAPASAPRH